VINEKPLREEQEGPAPAEPLDQRCEVQVQTTLGDFYIHLYSQECPKTCQNFVKLARSKYYEGLIFHRIIKGFIIQTGCPLGNGTGGESCWGGFF
jgi:peptidylprolyl isomerase domain and WD repeat-containing protein 1